MSFGGNQTTLDQFEKFVVYLQKAGLVSKRYIDEIKMKFEKGEWQGSVDAFLWEKTRSARGHDTRGGREQARVAPSPRDGQTHLVISPICQNTTLIAQKQAVRIRKDHIHQPCHAQTDARKIIGHLNEPQWRVWTAKGFIPHQA